jgi:alpha-L-fucosidase 2
LFNSVEKGYELSGDDDEEFIEGRYALLGIYCTSHVGIVEVRSKIQQMDKGIHIGSWGQLQGKIDI